MSVCSPIERRHFPNSGNSANCGRPVGGDDDNHCDGDGYGDDGDGDHCDHGDGDDGDGDHFDDVLVMMVMIQTSVHWY